MSIQIWNAFEYRGPRGVSGLLEALKRVRPDVVRAAVARLYLDLPAVTRGTDWVLYRRTLHGVMTDSCQAPLASVLGFIPDVRASAVLYLYGSRVFVQFFGVATAFCDPKTTSIPGLHDYHYQDRSDRPAGVTSRTWEARRRTWGYVFRGSPDYTPDQVGLRFSFVSAQDTWALTQAVFESTHGHVMGKSPAACAICNPAEEVRA